MRFGVLNEERLRAMIEIWTQDKAEFHGDYVDFDPIYCWPKPTTHALPPGCMWVVGHLDALTGELAQLA